MSNSLKPTGYHIKTFRMLLNTENPEWLKENQKRFQEVQRFYCEILQKTPHLYEMGSQQILRELELMTIPSKNNPGVERQIPWEKLPAYFRRAAINSVIGDLKSAFTRSNGQSIQIMTQSSAIFYQRMYRDFTSKKITLHVWNGEDWVWLKCRLHGNELPDADIEGVKWMSPTVVIEKNKIFLSVPVRLPVDDARKLKQRMADVKEAYQKKKWAFVSDYARFDILYHYGGVYFDTDVEVISSMDEIIEKGAYKWETRSS